MNGSCRYWLKKIIVIRKKLIREGKSLTNQAKNNNIIERLETWLNAFPNASDTQVIKFIQRNWYEIKYLIPGNKAGSSIFLEMQKIIHHAD
jgi:hypothetical protein